jgi:hypothetical protein
MSVLSMTQEPMQELKSLLIINKEAVITMFEETSIADMWKADLLTFEQAWRHQKSLCKLDRSFVNIFSGDVVLPGEDTRDREDIGD